MEEGMMVVCCVVLCVGRGGGVLYIIYIPYSNLDGEIVQSNRPQNIKTRELTGSW